MSKVNKKKQFILCIFFIFWSSTCWHLSRLLSYNHWIYSLNSLKVVSQFKTLLVCLSLHLFFCWVKHEILITYLIWMRCFFWAIAFLFLSFFGIYDVVNVFQHQCEGSGVRIWTQWKGAICSACCFQIFSNQKFYGIIPLCFLQHKINFHLNYVFLFDTRMKNNCRVNYLLRVFWDTCSAKTTTSWHKQGLILAMIWINR